ncbi:MAG: hypothetical protein M3R36_08230 [Bacteroidota bacterium]|nr:hypothetical protein [Bacteroidota bacterium]
MDISIIKEWFELLSYAATIIGIPLAIYVYYSDKNKERKIREKDALFTSHSLYVDYLKICLENPELNVYNTSFNDPEYSQKEKKELIIFEILFTYLESAYLFYKDQTDDIKNKRWAGWINYIKDFAHQDNFRKAWEVTEGQWDEDFMRFMNTIMSEKSWRRK